MGAQFSDLVVLDTNNNNKNTESTKRRRSNSLSSIMKSGSLARGDNRSVSFAKPGSQPQQNDLKSNQQLDFYSTTNTNSRSNKGILKPSSSNQQPQQQHHSRQQEYRPRAASYQTVTTSSAHQPHSTQTLNSRYDTTDRSRPRLYSESRAPVQAHAPTNSSGTMRSHRSRSVSPGRGRLRPAMSQTDIENLKDVIRAVKKQRARSSSASRK